MTILRIALGELRHEVVPVATADYWADRFAPAQEYDAGAGRALYRRCLMCRGWAMAGSLSSHARWCDRKQVARERYAEDQ